MPLHCSNCNLHLRIGLGCGICKDFKVCTRCYGNIGHQHDMKQVVLLLSTDLFPNDQHTKGCGSQVPVHCYIRNLLQTYRMFGNNPRGICQLVSDHFSGTDLTCNCIFCKKMFLVYKFHCVKCQDPLCRLENCRIINDQIFKHRFTSTNDDVLQKLMKIRVIMKRAQNPPAAKETNTSTSRNSALLRKFTIQRCIRTLVHASKCVEADCMPASCQKMKRILNHIKVCKRKVSGGCIICKQLCTLCCYHARTCTESKCSVLLCSQIKRKIRDAKIKKRCPA